MNCPKILQSNYGPNFCAACSMVAASCCTGVYVTVSQAIEEGAVDTNGFVNHWDYYATIPPSNQKAPLDSAMLNKIHDYINGHDCPVIIYTTPSHYCVAYASSEATEVGISVMDPLKGYTTLEELLTRKTWSGYRLVSKKA